MLQDIRTVNRKIHAYYPELPLILMGHSMGSLAVRAFVAEHDSCVDMLIVCGSPSYNTAMPLGVAIAKTEKAVFGPRHRSKLIETMSFGAGAMKFRKDKRCTAWICSDPDVAKEYEESELCGFTFTDDAYLALFELMKRAYDVGKAEGGMLLVVLSGLFLLSLAVPALFAFSEKGPGSMHAPALIALLIATAVGAAAYKTRLCMAGGIRDGIMFKDFKLLYGFIAIFLVALVSNLITNKFNLGFTGQPVAHSDHLWSFLGMALVGWGSVLLGGCPLRQLILAGSGNGDSAVTVLGMIVGAAFSHNFGLAGAAANAESAGGVGPKGRVAIIIGFVVMAVVSLMNMPKKED